MNSETNISHDGLQIVMLDTVEPRQPTWLWEGYLARGFVAILSGDPGAGKTFLACRILADLSIGRVPASEQRTTPLRALYISAEARPDCILVPRLLAMGADLSRIGHGDGLCRIYDDPEDDAKGLQLACLQPLREAIREHRADVIVLDPLQSFFGDGDSNNFTKVRPLMDNLTRLAQQENVCILVLRHLGKSTQTRAALRGLGSVDFTASVMTEAVVGFDPDDPERRVIAFTKNNLGKLGQSLAFRIGDNTLLWDGPSDLEAEELLAPPDLTERSQIEVAREFLEAELATGAKPMKWLESEAMLKLGVSTRTLQRASKALGIPKTRDGKSGPWMWHPLKG